MGILSEWDTWTCVESCGETTEYRNRTCEADDNYPGDPVMCPPDCSEENLGEEQNCYAGCCGSKLKVNMWHWSIETNWIEIKEVEKVFQKV